MIDFTAEGESILTVFIAQAPSADPFGSGGGSDPFGDSSADPFGEGKSEPFDEKSADPFGGKSTGRNRDSDSEVYLVQCMQSVIPYILLQ